MSTIMSTSNVSGDGPTLPLSAVGHVEVWSSQRDEGGFAEMLDHAPISSMVRIGNGQIEEMSHLSWGRQPWS